MTPVLDVGASSSKPFTPSPQQQAIADWLASNKGNLIIDAKAGSGKTTTLEWIIKGMRGTAILLAYNKKIADEISRRVQGAGEVRTFHSAGLAAWRRAYPNVQMDFDKLRDLLDKHVGKWGKDELRGRVERLVSLAKNHVVVPGAGNEGESLERLMEYYSVMGDEDENELILNLTYDILEASIKLNRQRIDFDDMLYAPLVESVPMITYDNVLVDECQDTNPARRELAKLLLKPEGRAIFVGDPHQAIYGFTGADADAMDLIAREFRCAKLPLSVSYRCPRKVVAFAQNWVRDIQAAPGAREGSVETVTLAQFRNSFKSLTRDSAIICRNTRPLVSTALELIRAGVPCFVEGKDIGKSLILLTKRWRITDAWELLERLDLFFERESAKLRERRKEREIEALADKIETIKVIIQSLSMQEPTVADVQDAIRKLFEDTPEGQAPKVLTLSTVHKAKGREWPTVYLLDRLNLMPSKWARQDWEQVQEDNLIYVAVTRAKERLVEIKVGE